MAVGLASLSAPRAESRLGAGCSERDHVVGVDGEVMLGFSLDKPRKLHDRAASRIEDRLFDVLGVSLEAVAFSGDDGQLRGGSHGEWGVRTSRMLSSA